MKKTLFFCLLLSLLPRLQAQITLNQPQTPTKTVIGTSWVKLTPGFTVSAQPGSLYHIYIDPNYIDPNYINPNYIAPPTVYGSVAATPSNDQNYIHTTQYLTDSGASGNSQQVITYFDGLGRPMQNIQIAASASGKDIVTPIEYDNFGRQTKDYLPYATSTTTGSYTPSALIDIFNFSQYTGQVPFSQKELEASPLNRVFKQAAPGNDWALNSGHEIKLDYQTNTTTEVKLFTATTIWNLTSGLYDIDLSQTGNYDANQLYKTITYDENTPIPSLGTEAGTQEFKNKEGQVVLKRTYDNAPPSGAGGLDTYYVYDIYGNLTYVIPPLVTDATIATQRDELCYQYKYDSRNRLVEKKLPGKQWEFIVYDKLDRVVATGPAFSPFNDNTNTGWLITKYDVFNRPVYTGWAESSTISTTERKNLQDDQNTATVLNETKTSSGTIDGIPANYSNTVVPTSFKLLTVNYYDNYTFPYCPAIPSTVEDQNVLTTTKSLATGSWVRALTSSASTAGETTATFYDAKARPIRNYLKNYMGGYTYTDTNLDFTGVPQYTKTYHKRLTTDTELKTTEVFTYSQQGRLLTHTHQINTKETQLLASNTYDELGKLIVKRVGGLPSLGGIGGGLQKVDYAYNIRGWMTGINNDLATNNLTLNTSENDLFSFKINYNTIAGTVTGVKSLYNGNIAETYWRTASDNVLRKYGYEYDNLNRLKNATYQKPENVNTVTNSYNENLTYDKNGNILSLQRNGDTDPIISPIGIDNLTYTYATNSNKLLNVLDNTNNTSGFKDGNLIGDDYAYDLNANLTTDKNKGITAITYNHLNLPTKITFGTTGRIEYTYNALGQKVQKQVFTTSQGGIPSISYYLSGFQYIFRENYADYFTKLQFVPTSEGYYDFIKSGYVFNYTDHLGNVRLSYKDTDNNGNISSYEILEENNYYPFGLKHSGYYTGNTQANYKYKFSGKELQDELGLNLYDYGARNYDPAIGRWMNIDPLAETSRRFSPYTYTLNNPVFFIDPDGRKERSNDYDGKMGKGDWREDDRTNDTDVWKNANTYNLQQKKGYKEYSNIEQRADFYSWFQETNSNGTKWAGAASEVASNINMLTWDSAKALGYSNNEASSFAEKGNRMIFEDAFPKLSALSKEGKLSNLDAKNWDAKMLSQEQNLIQPLYKNLSSETLNLISAGAKQTAFGSSWVASVKPFPANKSLLSVGERWSYGMKNMGYNVTPSQMPPPGVNYTNGAMYSTLSTKR